MVVKRTAVTSVAEQKLQLEHPSAEIIWGRAIEVFGDEQKARHWMRNPLPILDQHTPEQYANSNVPEKQREVLTILGAIDYGMYS
jgi:uncharacterized protein (DUF2384 family)